jgi:ABC-type glycerol-3-phosphate transport system permease component
VILARIILPLAKPALAVVALFTLLNSWNDFFGPLIYVNRDSEYTLALGIQQMRQALGEVGANQLGFPYLMAVSTIVTVPILIVFFFAQRTFIEGISLSGLKG